MKSENNVPENFSEIKLADQLRIFLDNPEHEEYHHFTNIDVLKEILISQRWKLSPAKNMNDQHEAIEKNISGLHLMQTHIKKMEVSRSSSKTKAMNLRRK